MKRVQIPAVLLITALGLRMVCVAQTTTAQETKPVDDSDAVFKSDSNLVELHATVKDSSGKLLTDIPERYFQLFENNIPQKISVFRQEDAPVSLGILIDNSESMNPKRAQVAAAALALVRSSNPEDEVFLVNFNEAPKLICDFTKDISAMEAALQTIDSNGATAIRDALSMGIEHLKRQAKNDKKVLLIVTDGEDNSSQVMQARVIREAQQSNVLIYSIGLLADADTRERARAQKDLDAITLTTGGEVFYPKSVNEVDSIARHIAKDLRHQYTLAYKSSNQRQDGTFRKIKLTVSGLPDAIVKTRDGYYASSGQTD